MPEQDGHAHTHRWHTQPNVSDSDVAHVHMFISYEVEPASWCRADVNCKGHVRHLNHTWMNYRPFSPCPDIKALPSTWLWRLFEWQSESQPVAQCERQVGLKLSDLLSTCFKQTFIWNIDQVGEMLASFIAHTSMAPSLQGASECVLARQDHLFKGCPKPVCLLWQWMIKSSNSRCITKGKSWYLVGLHNKSKLYQNGNMAEGVQYFFFVLLLYIS